MMQNILRIVDKIFPVEIVHAHCDIPCGIYDPHTALLAAKTVLKMVQKIKEIPSHSTREEALTAGNSLYRMVAVKEEHAQLCKKELLILWTDYFKSEHLHMFPDIHTVFWNAAKLCSKNKQNIDSEAAQQLVDTVLRIKEMFDKAEEAKKRAGK